MKLVELKRLVAQGESAFLEFKNSTGSLSTGMQTVCAFLNSNEGGILIFGVKDNGHLIGQIISDKTRKEIAAELNKIEPYGKISVKYVKISVDKYAIVIMANDGTKNAPYTYDGRSYVRNQSTNKRMSKEEYIYLYNKNNPTLWEGLTSKTCSIKDLDHSKIKEIIRIGIAEKRLPEEAMRGTIQNALKKLGLIIDDKLTNAAVLLFCKNEYKQFMQSNIQLARFKGTTKNEFLDNKMIKANAFDLFDKAMGFLVFALPTSARIEEGNPNRVETPAIPYTVLREALINALVHRDYSYPGSSITVAVYDDRITISNPGFLPSGISVKELAYDHKSIQRNPLIAHVFYLCGKIEKWGRGTLDMIHDSKKVGNPSPIFEEIGGGFSVTLPLKEPMSTIYELKQQINLNKLTDRQKEIINILSKGPMSRQELMNHLGTTITNRAMQLELAKLKKAGLIKPSGKGKAVIWFLQTKLPIAK